MNTQYLYRYFIACIASWHRWDHDSGIDHGKTPPLHCILHSVGWSLSAKQLSIASAPAPGQYGWQTGKRDGEEDQRCLLHAYAEPNEAPGSTATFCRIDAAASRKERTRQKMTPAGAQIQGSGRAIEGKARQDTIGQDQRAAVRVRHGGLTLMQTDCTKTTKHTTHETVRVMRLDLDGAVVRRCSPSACTRAEPGKKVK